MRTDKELEEFVLAELRIEYLENGLKKIAEDDTSASYKAKFAKYLLTGGFDDH